MEIYNISTAKMKLSAILSEAFISGEVKLKDKKGNLFTIKPLNTQKSPLDIEGIGLNMTSEEVIELIKEGRKY